MPHLHLNEPSLICDMWLNKITYLLDGKICMAQRKIRKTVILQEENNAFHHENIAY